VKTSCKAITDVGLVRQANEDSYLCDEELNLFAVADGMGGHKGGKTASLTSLTYIENAVRQSWDVLTSDHAEPTVKDAQVLECLAALVQQANREVFEKASQDASLEGMGTTLTVLWLHGNRAFIAHVGDSRCYLWRQGTLFALTEDHSWVQEQVKAGLMSPEEASASPQKNVITRSIGFEPHVAIDMVGLQAEPGDKYLVCSDGLSNMVPESVMAEMLKTYDVDVACHRLVQHALREGGYDNITALCVEYVQDRVEDGV
jgi:serine/threonine protein phosphatase PrpC